MDKKLMERFKVESAIHESRFLIMQHSLYLYGGRLKGEACLYEKYNSEEISASSSQGEEIRLALLELNFEEEKLANLHSTHRQIVENHVWHD